MITAKLFKPKRQELIKQMILFTRAYPLSRPRLNYKTVFQPIENQLALRQEMLRYYDKDNIISKRIIVDHYYYFKRDNAFTYYPISLKFGDEDNIRKGVNDSLVHCGIIDDDRYIVGGEQYKIYDDEEDFIVVQIYNTGSEKLKLMEGK